MHTLLYIILCVRKNNKTIQYRPTPIVVTSKQSLRKINFHIAPRRKTDKHAPGKDRCFCVWTSTIFTTTTKSTRVRVPFSRRVFWALFFLLHARSAPRIDFSPKTRLGDRERSVSLARRNYRDRASKNISYVRFDVLAESFGRNKKKKSW